MKLGRRVCLALGSLAMVLVVTTGIGLAQGRERVLVVSALEKGSRRPVESLSARDLEIREDGVAREALRISHMDEPMHLAILVDNSQAADGHITQLRDGLSRFLKRLGPQHAVSLVTYAERPTLVLSFSLERPPLTDAVNRLFSVSGSGAYLLDALEEAANGFVKRESKRPVIVVVDLGGKPFSHLSYGRVLDRITASGVQLHVLQVKGVSLDTSQEEREQGIVIDEGTRKTGGRRADLLTSQSLPDALTQLAAELESQYRVVYSRPDSLVPPSEVTVSSANPSLEIRGTALKTDDTSGRDRVR